MIYQETFQYGNNHPADVGTAKNGVSWVGAFDLVGNVWEWTSSLYTDSYPYNIAQEDMNDTLGTRVLRGGSFESTNFEVRSANRGGGFPEFSNDSSGFRCAHSVNIVDDVLDHANCTATVILDPGASLQLRAEPSVDARSLDLIPANTSLVVLQTREEWLQAEFEGTTGWFMSQYVNVDCNATQETEVADIITSTNSSCIAIVADLGSGVQLNLRQTPNYNSVVIARAKNDTQIEIYGRSADNEWLNGSFQSQEVWFAADFVSLTCEITSLAVIEN